MQELKENKLYIQEMNKYFHVVIACVICDTPARAYVKQVRGHSGYYGCDKCTQKGLWKGKMTFPETQAPLRTDIQFDELSDEHHHLGPSPFSKIQGVGLVSQFPLDYMHLVCLGVMRRLLTLWIKGPIENSCRIGANAVQQISEKLLIVSKYLPREFTRKGRSLREVDRWKATEFRQFLLYTGPVVLFDCLSKPKYQHFMVFSIGIYCLTSSVLCATHCEYANELLRLFVQDFATLYGDNMIVYNVHNLIHLANDASKFGPLDNFSAFVFESFLGKLKRLVRKPNYPLQQVIRRLSESSLDPRTKILIPPFGVVKKKHLHGPILRPFHKCFQYQEIQLPDTFLSVRQRDNCVLVTNKVVLVRNILCDTESTDSEKYIVYEEFGVVSKFFDVPLESSDLCIYVVSQLKGEMKVAKVSEIICKYVMLPFHGDKFVTIPLIHTL